MRAHAFEGVLGTLQPSIVRFCHIAAQQLASLQPVDGADVGMVERGQHLGLTLEPGESVRIVGEGLRQDLQGHVPVELGVSCSIHLAHAAFADLGGDLIWAEGGAEVK